MHEVELKLEVPADRRSRIESSLFVDAAVQTLCASYFDTADRRLASNQLALRLRKEGAQWVQTLKAGAANPLRRLEHNASVASAGDDGADPPLDLSRHAGTPAGDALQPVLSGDDAPLLHKLFHTEIVRRTMVFDLEGGTVEAAFDSGSISGGGRTQEVCEIEIELQSGSPAAMVALARRWVLEHGLWLSTTTKAARGDRLARGVDSAHAVHARPAAVERKMGGKALLGATLDTCLTHVLANASEVAAGNSAEEIVHQLRVGIRRLRTALRELGPLADGLDPAWEEALVRVFRQLGQLRDRETVTQGALAELAAAGAPEIELPAPSLAPPDAGQAVRATPFQMALLGLIGFGFELEGSEVHAKGRRAKSLRHVRRRLDKLHEQVVRDGRRFEAIPVDDQHRVRKRLKRLRYLGEFVAPLFKKQAAERYLAALKPAQDALGVRNDAAVALDAYRVAAAHDPKAWFAVGWLSAQEGPGARRCRKALKKIEAESRFWNR